MLTADDLLAQGQAALAACLWREAVETFTRILCDTPRHVGALEGRIEANMNLQCRPQAIADLDTLIKLWPQDASYYERRGHLRGQQRQYADAIEDLTRAATLKPELVTVYRRRAEFKFAAGDTAGTLADLDTAIRVEPEQAESHRSFRERILGMLSEGFGLDESVTVAGDH
jgi:tetratricopeptide (TPR) repeat protein